jgi:hypothetical protein
MLEQLHSVLLVFRSYQDGHYGLWLDVEPLRRRRNPDLTGLPVSDRDCAAPMREWPDEHKRLGVCEAVFTTNHIWSGPKSINPVVTPRG